MTLGRSQPLEPAADEAEGFEDVDLRHYLTVLLAHRRLVLTIMGVVVSAVMLATFASPNIYRTEAKVIIDSKESGQRFDFQAEGGRYYYGDVEEFQTQVEVLKSRPVYEEVARRIKVEDLPAPSPGLLRSLKSSLKALVGRGEPPPPADPVARAAWERSRVLASLDFSLDYKAIPDTRVVIISCEGPDPDVVAAVANTTAEVFSSLTRELKVKELTGANVYLSSHLAEIKEKLLLSENEIKRFQEDREAISVDRRIENLTEERIKLLTDLNTVDRELAEQQSSFATLEAQTREVREKYAAGDLGSFGDLKAKVADLELKLQGLLRGLTEQHPEVKTARRELDELRQQLDVQRKLLMTGQASSVRGIEQVLDQFNRSRLDVATLGARKAALNQVLAKTQESLKALLRLRSEYTLLQREVDSNQKIYDTILLRQKEVSLKEAMQLSDVKIIETALPPGAPVKPRKLLNLVLALIVGAMLGVAAALAADHLDQTLRTRDEIYRAVGLPVLATFNRMVGQDGRPVSADALARFVVERPTEPFSEGFRSLHTTLKFLSAEPPKTILVLSAGQGEGKTTVAVNLAHAFAGSGERVALVDADLRRPRLHQIFGLERSPGLTDVKDGAFAAAARPTASQKLDVVTCGTPDEHPSEFLHLWGSRLVETLSAAHDLVIFDSPPVNAVTDATILARSVDVVVLVVSSGLTTRNGLTMALETLGTVGARVAGVVVNNLPREGLGAYDYYRKYYRAQDGER